jgi:hypothetical protein
MFRFCGQARGEAICTRIGTAGNGALRDVETADRNRGYGIPDLDRDKPGRIQTYTCRLAAQSAQSEGSGDLHADWDCWKWRFT